MFSSLWKTVGKSYNSTKE